MPSILTDDEKQIVKRAVPKSANKIHAVAVAKLYIAYPNRARWTYTGITGAAVLANDLVGHTFWLKMVDISSANRGVLWDQEIYDTFQYNQDRTFFHSFELEECMAGFSFVDEKEAKQFKKKMDEREKNAHKNTRSRGFMLDLNSSINPNTVTAPKSRFAISNFIPGYRAPSSGVQTPTSIIPPRDPSPATPSPPQVIQPSHGIDLTDPTVQKVLNELLAMGITEDQIEQNADFIKDYLEKERASAAQVSHPIRGAPPPPPSNANQTVSTISPQNTGSSTERSKRGPAPAPPPSRRAIGAPPTLPVQRPPSPSPSPPPIARNFRVPPPISDAGKFAHSEPPPRLPQRGRADSTTKPDPSTPPRPPKEDLSAAPSQRFAVPPPFVGNRIPSSPVPPPPPSRGSIPPTPPRDHGSAPSALPPPLPPKIAEMGHSSMPTPQLPNRPIPPADNYSDGAPPTAPPLPPMSLPPRQIPTSGPPLPPPLPPSHSGEAPPPPPLPTSQRSAVGGPTDVPPPPPMPIVNATGAGDRGNLLADIRGGPRLRKVNDQDKRDRSAALVPGSEQAAAAAASAGATGSARGSQGADGGLAGALASALAARKSKVSHSDDEDDKDDW